MNALGCLELWRNDPGAAMACTVALSESAARAVIEQLKQEADQHWYVNANQSLEFAELIIQVGEARSNQSFVALGMMARGDALKHVGRMEEAWDALSLAGELFQAAGDAVGWARTRIGRLGICADLNHVAEALSDAQQARRIFTDHGEYDKLLRLDYNSGVVYYFLGEQGQALKAYQQALATALGLAEQGQSYVAQLHMNIGLVYEAMGDFRQALEFHTNARDLFQRLNETRGVGNAERNIATITMLQGHYRRALTLLHHVLDLKIAQRLTWDSAYVKRSMVACYLLLNRHAEARDLAKQAYADFEMIGAAYQQALTLLDLATAEAEQNQLVKADLHLAAAERLFSDLGASPWIATIQLRRGRIALQQNDNVRGYAEAAAAATAFLASGQQVEFANATLLRGQVLLATHELQAAADAGRVALRIAKRCNVPPLRYSAHLLLGRIAEANNRLSRARRRYWAAAATVERVQRALTITLRPGFLENKGEASQALIALQLRSNQIGRALETLERAKSQVLLSHLAHREQVHWRTEDPHCQSLIEEFTRLREEYHWLYRLTHCLPGAEEAERPRPTMMPGAELATCERRMRSITEELYLEGSDWGAPHVRVPTVTELQEYLPDDTVLIEYYSDSAQLWAFVVDRHGVAVQRLVTPVAAVDRLIQQLQLNIQAALSVGPTSTVARQLLRGGQMLLQRLYTALLAPIAQHLSYHKQVVIVPYGTLHYLPFHLLHTNERYLIEDHEVIILPAAGLITRQTPVRTGGVLVLTHSYDGRLPYTDMEARVVATRFDAEVYCNEEAQRGVLRTPPRQILHIAAHGEYRLDRPDLSYIELGDGQLYTDDLLQHDLSYELVTLSACETSRASVSSGDELIGLGRGFLYAGAGALIASLWRVADASTVSLMEQLYQSLAGGASKAAALRAAQCTLHNQDPALHPAFWGAFQLIGDARPLSVCTPSKEGA